MTDRKLDVLPGWRGTDPHGGTWVRRPADAMSDWIRYDREGVSSWRSQEQAEEANLVPLVAETNLKSLQNDRDGWRSEALAARFHEAAPAPLDPGNPEHLRQVADVLQSLSRQDRGVDDVWFSATWLLNRADRLDRERAEAERLTTEATKLAAVLADFAIYDTDGSRDDAILAGHLVRRGVRVTEERARQEEGQ